MILIGLFAVAMTSGTYVGVASCVNSGCHGSTVPLHAKGILQNEYFTWLNADRHAQAYNILFDARSTGMVRTLHLEKRAYEEPLCLKCHSTVVEPQRVSGHIDPEDGVQCETCHGPAGGWRNEHTADGWSHAQSVARGMTDLRDLPVRASLCLSCHLGDGQREVDHALIAAGHPALQFELDNYTATMPPHWIAEFAAPGARAWAVGEAASFAGALANLARHARGESWPEFSAFQCLDCHHQLSNGAWRQEQGWLGRPGLPAWDAQQWVIVRAILSRFPEQRSVIQTQLENLGKRVSSMRNPASIAEQADETRRIVLPLIQEMDRLQWSDNDLRLMMQTLAAPEEFLDVRAAEQTALSLQALASARIRRDPNLVSAAVRQAIDALFIEVRNRDDYDARRFAAKLRALHERL